MWLFVTLVLYLVDRAFLNCVQKKLQEEEYEAISQIQIADLNYIGTYISYFIIGVSVPSLEKNDNVFYVILCMLFIFLLRTKTVGFNIFHLLNGWHYYNVTNQDNYTMTVLLNRNNLRMVSALKVKLIHNNIYIGTA
ncbi:MAG: hypothetical protein EKK64_10035 [Neisseriaceae bacterium]|jgi:hypothetical protein|nr:MAG: hypothetical protein EKK64_10035 [Neisseriaceae bacterium]